MAVVVAAPTACAMAEVPKARLDSIHDATMMRTGITFGYGLNSVSASNVHQSLQSNFGAGWYINWMCGSLFFETGLNWQNREYDLKGFIPQYTSIESLHKRLNYIDIPIKLGIAIGMADFGFPRRAVILIPNVGMYGACLANRHTDGFRRMDLGGTIGFELYVKRFRFGFSYKRGWIDTNTHIDRHIKTKSFDFTIGYTFGTKISY